ncbi:hypothetical protein [Streptosporangium sp. NPDC002607]
MTGARLGKVPLETSRGTIQVPAWVFTFEGVEQRKVHVAVDPSAVTARPERVQGDVEEVMAFDLVAGKPNELLLRYGYGACDTIHGARAYETSRLVVVDVDERRSDSVEACPAILKTATITVTLAREPRFEIEAVKTDTWTGSFHASQGRVYAVEIIDAREYPRIFDLGATDVEWQVRVILRDLVDHDPEDDVDLDDWDPLADDDGDSNVGDGPDGLEEVVFQLWTPLESK